MERDPVTGRFLPGNKIAVGNRGNRNPKWGNKNAFKHGFYGHVQLHKFDKDGCLYVFFNRNFAYKVTPDQYFHDEQGRLRIHNNTSRILEKLGVPLSDI